MFEISESPRPEGLAPRALEELPKLVITATVLTRNKRRYSAV